MYLKKIVVNGFKSFYTRTEVDFSDDITCVVGPNGCGKSNILDAVRWVLGEQSAKQLRGDEISDVISAGNARRAQKNKAEAYLTFADVQGHLDTDRDEVEVGRIVNREGQGTYLLNGDEVRLKDVQDLFRDTGIGQDLYSIIGQGEVVKLIKSKPEERREIIEEAAGISTFRHRRDLTRRRLKQTREELETVEKELREKRARLSQLKGQAEKAEKVQSFQQQLRECRIEKSRREFLRLKDSLDHLEKSIKKARKNYKKLEHEKSESREQLEDSEQDLQLIRDKIQNFESVRQPLKQCHQELREEGSRLRTRCDSIADQVRRDRQNIHQKLKQQESTVEEVESLHRSAYRQSLRNRIAGETVSVLEDREQMLKVQGQKLRDQLEGIRSRSLFEISEESEVKHRLQATKEQHETLKNDRDELEDFLNEIYHDLDQQRQTFSRRYHQLIDEEVQWVQLRLSEQRQTMESRTLSRLSDQLDEILRSIRQKRESLTSRRDSLRQFVNNYEGFYPGVRALMNDAEETELMTDGMIHGVLANLLTVEEKFEDAVEAALEQEIQAIVVEKQDDALAMLQFLRDHEAGHAKIFTVDDFHLQGSDHNGSEPELPGARRALEPVDVDETIQPIVEKLLDNTWIVEDLDQALRLRERHPDVVRRGRIVTFAGEILEGYSAISGGSKDPEQSGLLHRIEELETMEKSITELDRKERRMKYSISCLNDLMSTAENRARQIDNALQGIRHEHREYRRKLDSARSRCRELRNEFESGATQLVDMIKKKSRLSNELQGLEVVQFEVTGRESQRRRETRELRAQVADVEDRLDRQQKRIRNSLRNREEASARVREIRNRIRENRERFQQYRDDIQTLLGEVQRLKQERIEIYQDYVKDRLEIQRLEQEIRNYREMEEGWNQRQSDHQRRLRTLNRNLQEQERETEEARNRLERLRREQENEEARLTELREGFAEEYDRKLSEETLPEPSRQDMNTEELGKEIRRLQGEIRSMQPVNMLAKKELDELEDEVESIATQKNDLEESCDKLDRMIRRLNYRARTQFKEAFEEIQGYFEDFIQELFNGGEGRLGLTDDPVLDAGVTLEIQPPGEKLKSLSALSGGEKNLSALAFLFALFERKATPFAFLDEVDAPFDDENVAQFISLIDRYSDRTQFVIITHNKATMQAASQLYGVTMEESGVSSLVSVELKEAESLREQPRMATS